MKSDEELDQKDKEIKNESDGVIAKEVMFFLQCTRPQLDKDHQDILDDFLTNIEFNMKNRDKVSQKEFLTMMDNFKIRDHERTLNASEMTTVI